MKSYNYFFILFITLTINTSFALADTSLILTTKTYKITLIRHCEEGDLDCENVSYTGINLKTGKVIHLKGHEVVHYCPDDWGDGPGKTVCNPWGYKFVNGIYTYYVDNIGILRVSRGDKIILEEKGNWDE